MICFYHLKRLTGGQASFLDLQRAHSNEYLKMLPHLEWLVPLWSGQARWKIYLRSHHWDSLSPPPDKGHTCCDASYACTVMLICKEMWCMIMEQGFVSECSESQPRVLPSPYSSSGSSEASRPASASACESCEPPGTMIPCALPTWTNTSTVSNSPGHAPRMAPAPSTVPARERTMLPGEVTVCSRPKPGDKWRGPWTPSLNRYFRKLQLQIFLYLWNVILPPRAVFSKNWESVKCKYSGR